MFSFVENSGNFSDCSLTAMKEKVEDLKTSIDDFCFENLEFDSNFEVEISQCGNFIGKMSNYAHVHESRIYKNLILSVEAGEQCDCGNYGNLEIENLPLTYLQYIRKFSFQSLIAMIHAVIQLILADTKDLSIVQLSHARELNDTGA